MECLLLTVWGNELVLGRWEERLENGVRTFCDDKEGVVTSDEHRPSVVGQGRVSRGVPFHFTVKFGQEKSLRATISQLFGGS